MASELQEWRRRALDAEKRCLRVARGLADALKFISRLDLDTAVRVSIAELQDIEATQDPIAAAVDAQLGPLGDELKAFGHKLAKAATFDELTEEQRAYYERHCGDGCRGCPYCMRPSDAPGERRK